MINKQRIFIYGSAALASVDQLNASSVLETFKEAMVSLAAKSGDFSGLNYMKSSFSIWDSRTTPVRVITKEYAASVTEEEVFVRNCVVFFSAPKNVNDVTVVINWKIFLKNIIAEMSSLPILGLCIHYMRDFIISQYASIADHLGYVLKHDIGTLIGGKPMPLDIAQESKLLPFSRSRVSGALASGAQNIKFVRSMKTIFDELTITSLPKYNNFHTTSNISWLNNCSIINLSVLSVLKNIGTLTFNENILPPNFRCRYTSMFSELFMLSRFGGDPKKTLTEDVSNVLAGVCGISFKSTYIKGIFTRVMVLDLLKVLPFRVACPFAPYGSARGNVVTPLTSKLSVYKDLANKVKEGFISGKIPQAIAGSSHYSLLKSQPDGGANTAVVFVDLDKLEHSYGRFPLIDSGIIFSIPRKDSCRLPAPGRPPLTLTDRTFTKKYAGTLSNLSIEFIFGATSMLYRLKNFDVKHLTTPESLIDLTERSKDISTARFRGFSWSSPLRAQVIFKNTYLNKVGLCAVLEHAYVHDNIPEWSPAWLKDFLKWIDDNTVKTRIEFKQLLKHVREEETQRAKSAEVNSYFTKELLNLVLNTFRGQRKKIYDVSSVHRDALLKIPQDILEHKAAELRKNLIERGECNLNCLPYICLTPDIKLQVNTALNKAVEEGRITDKEYLHIKALNDKKRVYKQYKLSTKQVKNAIESINNNG